MTRFAPNARLLQAAHQLDLLSRQVTEAVDHVNHELAIADSYPTQTPGASIATSHGDPPVCRCEPGNRVGCDVCAPITLTATERAADQRWRLLTQKEQIRDDITAIEELVASLAIVVRKTLGMRRAIYPKRLCDCSGHDGAELARADGGWSDPTCEHIADKVGLCSACYMRKRRFLERIGKPAREDAA